MFSACISFRISVSHSYKMSCCHLSAHGSLDVSHIANGNPRHHRSRLRTVPHRTLLTAPPPFSTSDSRRTSLGILLIEKNTLSFVRPIVAYGRGCIECPVGAQNIGTHQAGRRRCRAGDRPREVRARPSDRGHGARSSAPWCTRQARGKFSGLVSIPFNSLILSNPKMNRPPACTYLLYLLLDQYYLYGEGVSAIVMSRK